MNKTAIFNFNVNKEDHTINVERSFNAPLDLVWAAWTEPEHLCQWWAPKPYQCVIKSLDFREGGRCLYYMQGPKGDRHWCFFDYEQVRPKTFYSGTDAFCDEHGIVNKAMPQMKWENRFSEEDGRTIVRILITARNLEDIEKIIAMGFKEGFTTGLDQLDELLAQRTI